MRRRLALLLALALLALCLTPGAPAQEPLTELWSEYPLYQPDKQPAAQAAEPESRSAQEPETLPAPEPAAPVPAGQERSGEGSTEAIGPTADGPETLPWMLIAPLTWAAITLLLAALPSHVLGLLHMPFLVDKRLELGLWGLAVGVSVVVGLLVTTMVP
jgi:hypothetical protein